MKLKYIVFTLFTLIIVVLIGASFIEKIEGTPTAFSLVYDSLWFTILWGLMAVVGMVYIIRRKLFKRPITFAFHLSFVFILIGAGITHFFGIQGSTHIRKGETTDYYITSDHKINKFPFTLSLVDFQVENYPGTMSAMDYVSIIKAEDKKLQISMNHIGQHRGYRFYQSGYDEDGEGTMLSVAYDPWGIGMTYTGYGLLFLSMLMFLISPNEGFRKLLKNKTLVTTCLLVLTSCIPASAQEKGPRVLPKDVAEQLGNLYTYYNGRICPLQTIAKDFTTKLYGKASYKGYTPEQVFWGWILFPTTWTEEPMIKVKSQAAQAIGIKGSYASYLDFHDTKGYKLEDIMNQLHSGQEVDGAQAIHEADEKMNILLMLFNGQLLKIYPYKSEDEIRWFSQADKLPEELESEENKEQWFFIKKTQDYMAEQAVQENYNKVLEIASKILKYQKQEAEGTLPSNRVFHAEKQYNTIDYTRPMAMAFATIGIILFFIYVRLWIKDKKPSKKLSVPLCIILVLAILYLGYLIGLRGYISGHLPLTNGYETMQFMAFCTLILTLLLYRRYTLIMPYGFLLTGLTLLVNMMGQSNPQITLLMPVLASPLLSIHVCVIMLAYSLMAFCLFNGITALLLPKTPMYDKQIGQLTRMSKLMLYPALFCLTAGIFIGAIWANVSWGRYWGWDPKEVWALITMMVYAVPLHQASIPFLRNPKWFHLYMILAFLSVLFTYFGVNFVLGGMHSYAG